MAAGDVTRYPKGTVIVQENDPKVKDMYILLQGSIGVYKNFKLNSEMQTSVLSSGNFWGETSLFLSKEPESTLVALSDVIVLTISRKNAFEFFAGRPDMTFNIFEGICKRLDDLNAIAQKSQGAPEQGASRRSSLFPEGHGSYTLPLCNDNDALYEQKMTCPICGHTFPSLTVITSKLRLDRTDPDMRTRYKDIEPLYYEIVSCPSCFFSASVDSFPTVSKKFADGINQKVGPYRLEMYAKTGMDRDTFTVFAGYYLAILSAAICFDDSQMITANLWQKLSRLYQDVDDNNMFLYASEQSLKDYLYSYENLRLADKLIPQLCFVIGDLYQRLGDINKAKTYFFQAKTNNQISNVLKRQVENRLEELKGVQSGS